MKDLTKTIELHVTDKKEFSKSKTKEELQVLKEQYNDLSDELKKLDKKELEFVTGGTEPEEFDWKQKDYITPVKDQHKEGEWDFSGIGDSDYNPKNNKTSFDEFQKNNKK